jgi:hypothetical protein
VEEITTEIKPIMEGKKRSSRKRKKKKSDISHDVAAPESGKSIDDMPSSQKEETKPSSEILDNTTYQESKPTIKRRPSQFF